MNPVSNSFVVVVVLRALPPDEFLMARQPGMVVPATNTVKATRTNRAGARYAGFAAIRREMSCEVRGVFMANHTERSEPAPTPSHSLEPRTVVSQSVSPRWRERPYLGGVIRLLALVLPVVAAVAASAALSRILPSWHSVEGVIARTAILLVGSGVVLFAVERLARRLIPLGLLLQLSISFPDRAPSRMRLAHRAGSVRRLERHLAEARAAGVEDEPTLAAERIITLMASLAAHDRKTRGHSERVRVFSDLVADELRLSRADRDRLRWAALLHDIGKLHLDAEILNKDGKPSEAEWEAIYRHPTEGARLAAPLFGWLGAWAAAIEQHHERYDGTGYPNRLNGKDISLGARIVGVADAYERMTSTSSYKKPVSAAAAREELTRCAGTQFDPGIVRAFLSISIGKLWWRTGPLSFLAQVPLLAWLPRLASNAGPIGSSFGAVAGAAAGVAALTVSGLLGATPGAPHSVAVAADSTSVAATAPPVVLGTDLDRSDLAAVAAPAGSPSDTPNDDPPPLDDPNSNSPRVPVSSPNVLPAPGTPTLPSQAIDPLAPLANAPLPTPTTVPDVAPLLLPIRKSPVGAVVGKVGKLTKLTMSVRAR
jgi:putative nucleotidyltransferase with HDIG domain